MKKEKKKKTERKERERNLWPFRQPSVSAISAYVIEVKTKGGIWREIRRVSPEETEAVVPVEDDDQLKFRIKAEEKNDGEGKIKEG